MTRIQGQEIKRGPKQWCSQLEAPFSCEVGSGGREFSCPIFSRHTPPPKFGPLLIRSYGPWQHYKPSIAIERTLSWQLGCEAPAEASREARAGRAGGLPGPLLARAPAAPVRSGALCAARRCFWQYDAYVWFALEAPFRVQHLLPCSSGKLHPRQPGAQTRGGANAVRGRYPPTACICSLFTSHVRGSSKFEVRSRSQSSKFEVERSSGCAVVFFGSSY
jgi:hypothetical protein